MIIDNIKNIQLKFQTDTTVFSPSSIDRGTTAMLSIIEFNQLDKVLDLGCGYGVVGILAAKLIGQQRVIMCDVCENAVNYAKINCKLNNLPNMDIRISDGFNKIVENDFTLILSNPPYHENFSVAKQFIENGFKHLVVGGRMVMVTKRLDWYKNKLTTIFGGVKVHQIDGYYIFIAEKRNNIVKKKIKSTKTLSKKLQRKYAK